MSAEAAISQPVLDRLAQFFKRQPEDALANYYYAVALGSRIRPHDRRKRRVGSNRYLKSTAHQSQAGRRVFPARHCLRGSRRPWSCRASVSIRHQRRPAAEGSALSPASFTPHREGQGGAGTCRLQSHLARGSDQNEREAHEIPQFVLYSPRFQITCVAAIASLGASLNSNPLIATSSSQKIKPRSAAKSWRHHDVHDDGLHRRRESPDSFPGRNARGGCGVRHASRRPSLRRDGSLCNYPSRWRLVCR